MRGRLPARLLLALLLLAARPPATARAQVATRLPPRAGAASALPAETGYELWLRYGRVRDPLRLSEYRAAFRRLLVPAGSPTLGAARDELGRGLSGLLAAPVPSASSVDRDGVLVAGTPRSLRLIASLPLAAELRVLGEEGFLIRPAVVRGRQVLVLAANRDVGVLYGAFALLRALQTGTPVSRLAQASAPRLRLRLLDHWDNLDGSVERGYAGRSIWQWDSLPARLSPRYRDYARANASIGINGVALTNVNADARVLTSSYLARVAALAGVLRPYGIRVYLTARFSAPKEIGGLETADPLEPRVRAWWAAKADEIYRYVPDFGGFLVKANSEGQPGPQDYHRTHADGANMLADAVAPHGGIVMWRAFVYSTAVPADRVKQAYDEFTPLDGRFRPNVLVQVKNGPLDFQPREPFHPLFGAMPRTPLVMELQITKEYLGMASHLVYLAPLWKEVLEADTWARGPGSTVARVLDGTLPAPNATAGDVAARGSVSGGIAGVANVGRDTNWTGSHFNQANWFAFGRLAWDHTLSAGAIAGEWIRMTFTGDPTFVAAVTHMMLASREAAVNYMTPLGLAHLMGTSHHYGPASWADAGRPDWTPSYYHRADSVGLGFDRTRTGSEAVAQYFQPVRERYASRATVPDSLLLWFHHVGWGERLRSGRPLWDELLFRYQAGVDTVGWMRRTWDGLRGQVDDRRFADVASALATQEGEARWWRDASVLYFQTFSRMPLPPDYPRPAHTLEFYRHLKCPADPTKLVCPELQSTSTNR